jgi:hypothetical protein
LELQPGLPLDLAVRRQTSSLLGCAMTFPDLPPAVTDRDLVEALRELEQMARDGHRALVEGRAVTGTSALRNIETRAADYARWATEDFGTGAPGEDSREEVVRVDEDRVREVRGHALVLRGQGLVAAGARSRAGRRTERRLEPSE